MSFTLSGVAFALTGIAFFAAGTADPLSVPAQEQDPFVRRISHPSGVTAVVDLRTQRLEIDVPVERDFGDEAGAAEERIVPRLRDLAHLRRTFVSAAELAQKAKCFDDGLMAAVELAAQRGAADLASKAKLLETWAGLAVAAGGADGESGLACLLAAEAQDGDSLELHEPSSSLRRNHVERFLADELRSKPLGFYTWSSELEGVFRQDRLLQELHPERDLARVLAALRGDAALRAGYEQLLALARGLTNEFAGLDLAAVLAGTPIPREGAAILPPSRSFEGDLVKRLYGARSIPDGFDLAQAFVEGVRSGSLSLAPGQRSGWYDHQSFALEPLAVPDRAPEAERLKLTERYREELVKLLKGMLALTRETHVKQLEVPTVGAAAHRVRIAVAPELRVEPLPTHYLRRARAYEFVERLLRTTFGKGGLDSIHGLRPGGGVESTLASELAFMGRLFRGAALCSCQDLGLSPQALDATWQPHPLDLETFTTWSAKRLEDGDLADDVRLMVPVFFDVERGQTKVWVVLGWTRKPLHVSFDRRPSVGLEGRSADRAELDVAFEGASYDMLYPVTAEIYVARLLDRGEMRALCDRERTQKKILAALESLR